MNSLASLSKYFNNVTEAWNTTFIQLSLLFFCHSKVLIVNGSTYLISRQLNKTQVNDDNYSYMVYADSVCKDSSSKSPKAVQIILTLSTLSEEG